MAGKSITTEAGTIVTFQESDYWKTTVFLQTPDDDQKFEAGLIDRGGFMPNNSSKRFILRPAVLRAIADLIEGR